MASHAPVPGAYVAVGLVATGLRPAVDEVVEFAFRRVFAGRVDEEASWPVAHRGALPIGLSAGGAGEGRSLCATVRSLRRAAGSLPIVSDARTLAFVDAVALRHGGRLESEELDLMSVALASCPASMEGVHDAAALFCRLGVGAPDAQRASSSAAAVARAMERIRSMRAEELYRDGKGTGNERRDEDIG